MHHWHQIDRVLQHFRKKQKTVCWKYESTNVSSLRPNSSSVVNSTLSASDFSFSTCVCVRPSHTACIASVFLNSLIIVNIRGMLRHDVRYIWLIGNHHILHHKYPQYNFGEYWLDTLFDTRCPIVSEYKKGLIYL
jgi:hypothetical protein